MTIKVIWYGCMTIWILHHAPCFVNWTDDFWCVPQTANRRAALSVCSPAEKPCGRCGNARRKWGLFLQLFPDYPIFTLSLSRENSGCPFQLCNYSRRSHGRQRYAICRSSRPNDLYPKGDARAGFMLDIRIAALYTHRCFALVGQFQRIFI